MEDLDAVADRLNRLVKLALDTGEADSLEAAEAIFRGYRLQVLVGPDVAARPQLQAALLTAVNCASRCLLGGITVVGAHGPLQLNLPPWSDLAGAVAGLGGRLATTPRAGVPTVVIGDWSGPIDDPLAVRATAGAWAGGSVTVASGVRLDEAGDFTPAGALAGTLAVGEVFQRLRGGQPMACRRAAGIDLWAPERDWRTGGDAPALERLPASAWLIGLGNLGQANLWMLGLLPYSEDTCQLVLQDFDHLAPSNLSTSLLTFEADLRRRKTRAMADWAERRGFRTALLERTFAPDFRVRADDPPVALAGVDNGLARQGLEDVGFERIIETGLGRGPQDYLGIDLHTFPASRPARAVWRDVAVQETELLRPAYLQLLNTTQDHCGTVRLAGRSIGAPFVGAAAAALSVAELVRLTMGAHRYELVSCHLRDLALRTAVHGERWQAFNPGSVPRAA